MIVSLLEMAACFITAFAAFLLWKELKEIHEEQKKAKDKEYLQNMPEILDEIKKYLDKREISDRDRASWDQSENGEFKASSGAQESKGGRKEVYGKYRTPDFPADANNFLPLGSQKKNAVKKEATEAWYEEDDGEILTFINESLIKGKFDFDGSPYRLIEMIDIKNSEAASSRVERAVFSSDKNGIIGIVCLPSARNKDNVYYAVPLHSFIQKSQTLASAFKYLYQTRDIDGNYVPSKEMEIKRLDRLAKVRYDAPKREYQLLEGKMGIAVVR